MGIPSSLEFERFISRTCGPGGPSICTSGSSRCQPSRSRSTWFPTFSTNASLPSKRRVHWSHSDAIRSLGGSRLHCKMRPEWGGFQLPRHSDLSAVFRRPRRGGKAGTCSCSESKADGSQIADSDFRISDQYKRLHFIGIGGAGLSALAWIAIQQGCTVSGSDLIESEKTRALRNAGAIVHIGHAKNNLFQSVDGEDVFPDAVIYSSAVKSQNEELQLAASENIPIFIRGEWLGYFTKFYELIAIAGTHGKSTTSSMVSLCLLGLNKNINALIGADVIQFPDSGNAIVGDSKLFVLEADEYDNCFLNLSPKIAVVTNVEYEHVDVFSDEEHVRASFRKFVQKIHPEGVLILCNENPGSKSLITAFNFPNGNNETDGVLRTDDEISPGKNESESKNFLLNIENETQDVEVKSTKSKDYKTFPKIITYGLNEKSDFRAVMLSPNIFRGTDFVVVYQNQPITKVHLQVPGIHNVLNALAAITLGVTLTHQNHLRIQEQNEENDSHVVDILSIRQTASSLAKTLSEFRGIKRRFEYLGSSGNVEVFDDYAHHPTEIRATLQAAKQILYDKKLWVIFQPHTYSRLSKLLLDFAPAFTAADRVIVTKVYAAREENLYGVDGKTLADCIIGVPANYIPTQEEILERIKWEFSLMKNTKNEDERIAIIIMGAGDITELGPKLLISLS